LKQTLEADYAPRVSCSLAEIILLDQYSGLGGGQRILMDLARAFRNGGHGVRVLVPGTGSAGRSLADEAFTVFPLPLPDMTAGRKTLFEKAAYPLRARRAAKSIEAEIARRRADLIYANAPRCFLPAVLAARRTGVPVACALHLIFTGGMEHRLIRWCFRQPEVKRVIFCSSSVAAPFAGSAGSKAETLHYWVSPAFLEAEKDRAAAREVLGLRGFDVAVGVLGRISRTKGQRMFLEALVPLLDSHPRLKLFVAGAADFEDPGEDEIVRALSERAADRDRVVVTGTMVESMPFLDALDVLVVPSLWEEPFGLVAVEGMARRLPVVVTRSGGLTEIVEHGVTGLHVDKTAAALRAAVASLVEDPVLRANMGDAGRARVEAMFNPSRQIALLMEKSLG